MKGLRLVIISILFILSVAGLNAQPPVHNQRFDVFIDNNINGFWEYLPRDYQTDISTNYPLLIYLHGAGDIGTVQTSATLDKLKRNGLPKIISNGTFPESFTVNGQTFRFIVISPQLKSGVSGLTSTISPATVDAVIDYAVNNYRVDHSRIYLAGMSMGGGGTWDYAGSEMGSKKLAGIVVAAGAADITDEEAGNIAARGIPVLATHNTVDQVVFSSRTIQNISKVQTRFAGIGPEPKTILWETPGYHNEWEFDNGEHNVWSRTFEDIEPGITIGGNLRDTLGENVYEWMLQFFKSDAVVPVKWENFTVRNEGSAARLEWKVSEQVNVKEFIVESSSNNRDFSPLANIQARQGISSIVYNYVDPSPHKPKVFYRIKQVDADGGFSYSVIKKINTGENDNTSARFFPNPVTNKLYLDFATRTPGDLLINIFDLNGRSVRSAKVYSNGYIAEVPGMDRLPPGMYFISISSANGTVISRSRIIKQ